MKRTDLEKLQAKKLDIRQSQERRPPRFGERKRDAAAEAARGQGLLARLLGQAVEKK